MVLLISQIQLYTGSTELRLLVVGSSGPSQFLLTNAILGREVFSKDITGISDSKKNTGELAGRRVAVINGPNIYDKDISRAKRKMGSKCKTIYWQTLKIWESD